MESQGFRSGLLSSITTDLEDIPYNETSYSKYFSVIDDYRLFNEQVFLFFLKFNIFLLIYYRHFKHALKYIYK